MNKIDLSKTHDVIGIFKKQDYSLIAQKYKDAGTKYAFYVLEEKVLTGYPTKLAAFRHLQDLKRVESGTSDFNYHYDLNACKVILNFAEFFPDVETGVPIKLMPWQKFILCQLVGWRDSNEQKRYVDNLISIARGQGKTELMALLTCYALLFETLGLNNQDLLVSSITYKQTDKLFGYIYNATKKLIEHKPFSKIAKDSNLCLKYNSIIEKNTNNVLREITFKGEQYDSYHFLLAIFDEGGDVLDAKPLSKITSGQIKTDNHQFNNISTAYGNPNAPFYSDEKRLITAMEQDYKRELDQRACLVWCQDSTSETFKPETWVKSNPLLEHPGMTDKLMKGLLNERESKLSQGLASEFQNKSLNIWLQSKTDSFLKLDEVEEAVVDKFDITGRQVYIGFDMSMMSDNTALGFVYPYLSKNGDQKFHIEQHSFIPWHSAGSIEAKEKQDGVNYRDLAKSGYCSITNHEFGLISNDQVYRWLLDFVEENKLEVIMFGYDAKGATTFTKRLEQNTSWKIMAINQRTPYLKDPTKFLQKIFIERSVTSLNDPILKKSLVNAEIYEDKIGIQVDKEKSTYKIDVVDALIDAFYQAMFHFEDFSLANDPSEKFARMTPKEVAQEIHRRVNNHPFG